MGGVVCGFEMLARFDSPLQASPDQWLAAAARHDHGLTDIPSELVAAVRGNIK